jgi:hypothetical protein
MLFPRFVIIICDSLQFTQSAWALSLLARIIHDCPELIQTIVAHPFFPSLLDGQDSHLRSDAFLNFMAHIFTAEEIRSVVVSRIHWQPLLSAVAACPQLLNCFADLLAVSVPEVFHCEIEWNSFVGFLARPLIDGTAAEKLAAIRCLSVLVELAIPVLIASEEFAVAFDQLLLSDDTLLQAAVLRFLRGALQSAIVRPNTWQPFFASLANAGIVGTLESAEWSADTALTAQRMALSILVSAGELEASAADDGLVDPRIG